MSRSTCIAILLLLPGWAVQAAPPKVTSLFPPGGQRGQSVVVTTTGDVGSWPLEVWADRPGVSVAAESEKGKLKVSIAADAVPGVCWMRAYNAEGASSLLPFMIDQLPELVETESNDLPEKPQALEGSAIVNGKLGKSGDVDGFTLPLKKGQTLVASVQANAILGSPMDAALQICELVSRRASSRIDAAPQVEAYVVAQAHDGVGLDPLLVYTAPRDGACLVRMFAFPSEPNSSINFAGGDNYVYRLTLATSGFLDHVLPLSVSGNEPIEAKAYGNGLPEDGVPLSLGPATASDEFVAAFVPGVSGSMRLPRITHKSVVADTTASPDSPQKVETPITISGRLAKAGDAAAFTFAAKKGQSLKIEVDSRELGFPLDPTLVVSDSSGKAIQAEEGRRRRRESNPTFNPPADGEFTVRVRDLHQRGGLRFIYRLTIAPVAPDYSISLAGDAFNVKPGKSLEIPVTIDRRDGFDKPITIQAVGLPEGLTAAPVVSEPKGDTAKAVKLAISASPDAKPFAGAFRIEGRSEGDNATTHVAHFTLKASFAGEHSAVWLTVEKP